MIRLTSTAIAIFCASSLTFSQIAYTDEKEIYSAKEFTFYGYDFTDFKLAEVKRLDEDIVKYMWGWIGLMQEKITEERLKDNYRKEKVTINFTPTIELAKKLKGENLVTYIKHIINKDSLQQFIGRYTLSEKEGIGLVMIVECFDKKSARTSGYFVWFDISTRKIIKADYVDQKEADGYGMVNYWGIGLGGVSTNYAAAYRKKLKTLSKS
jgi:hypothetical protein